MLGHVIELSLLLCCDYHFPLFPLSISSSLRVTQLFSDGFQHWGAGPLWVVRRVTIIGVERRRDPWLPKGSLVLDPKIVSFCISGPWALLLGELSMRPVLERGKHLGGGALEVARAADEKGKSGTPLRSLWSGWEEKVSQHKRLRNSWRRQEKWLHSQLKFTPWKLCPVLTTRYHGGGSSTDRGGQGWPYRSRGTWVGPVKNDKVCSLFTK